MLYDEWQSRKDDHPKQWRIQTFTDGGANRELGLSMLCLGISYCGKPIHVRPHRFTRHSIIEEKLSLLSREKICMTHTARVYRPKKLQKWLKMNFFWFFRRGVHLHCCTPLDPPLHKQSKISGVNMYIAGIQSCNLVTTLNTSFGMPDSISVQSHMLRSKIYLVIYKIWSISSQNTLSVQWITVFVLMLMVFSAVALTSLSRYNL